MHRCSRIRNLQYRPPYRLTALPPYRLPPHAAYDPVGLTVGVARAIDQAKYSVRFPPIIPQAHGDSVLTRKSGRGQIVGIERDMGMDGSGPLGRAAALHRPSGGDCHRVRVFRLEGVDTGDEHGVVADEACQARDPLLPCAQAVLPQIPQCTAGFGAELKPGPWAGRISLCRAHLQRYEAAEQQAGAAEQCPGQYGERGKRTAPRGPSISQMTSSPLYSRQKIPSSCQRLHQSIMIPRSAPENSE